MKKDSYGAPILTEKERAHQIKKEATISMIMYAAFFYGGISPVTDSAAETRAIIHTSSGFQCGFSLAVS